MSGIQNNKVRHFALRSFAICIAVLMLGTARAEASTFLLQFGSFNTQEQANQKWQDVKTKNADVVGKLTLHVAEVALPPDNTVMYRTQAGPLASHAQAANLCSTLQSRGVDCFVVETALFTGEPIAEQAQNDEVSPPTLPPLNVTPPVPVEPTPPAPKTSTITTPVESATLPPPPPVPAPPAPSVPAKTPVVPPLVTAAPTTSAAAQETNKPGFFGRLFGSSSNATSSAPTAAPAARKPIAGNPAPSAADQPEAVTYTPNTPPVPSLPAPAVMVAPVVPIVSAEAESVPYPIPPGTTKPMAPHASDQTTPEPMPVPMPMPAAPKPAVTSDTSPEHFDVPVPPPAPKTTAEQANADWAVPGRQPRSLTSELKNGSTSVADNTVPTPPPPSSNIVGDVKVAEAIRVPLGSGGPAKKLVILPPVHGLGGSPSATTHKTFWAQLSYFPDEMQARSFYDKFRADYPQFSDGVRVRITRPYLESAGRVSLRVGPFAGTDDVQTICKAAMAQGLSCTVVKELGTSSSMSNARDQHSLYHNNSETIVVNPEQTKSISSPKYWVQLGSFHTPDEAWDNWKMLQDQNKKLLRKVHANVSAPPMSSASKAMYRLRAGPFSTETSADSLCDNLDNAGVSCITVNDSEE